MINFNKVLIISFILTLSGCFFSVGFFKENPLNGCSEQKSGKWCPPSLDINKYN